MQHIVIHNLYNPTFTLENCDGSPMDLSTSTVKFILKREKNVPDEQALLSGEYVNPTTNILQYEFDAVETGTLVEGTAIGALKIYRAGDKDEEVWSDEYIIGKGVFNG
jgi:hypothetical protein